MKISDWIKPGLLGAVVGAIALAVVGFNWAGWHTSDAAEAVANKESKAAVALALTPYCVERSQNDPKSASILASLKEATAYNRRGIVEQAGWATPLGETRPNTALAEACQQALFKAL